MVAQTYDNFFINNNPQISLFKSVYRRHTNFSKTEQVIRFDNRGAFGTTFKCEVKKFGDLVHKMFLKIRVGELEMKYNELTFDGLKKFFAKYDLNYDYENHLGTDIVTPEIFDNEISHYIDNAVNEIIFLINECTYKINLIEEAYNNECKSKNILIGSEIENAYKGETLPNEFIKKLIETTMDDINIEEKEKTLKIINTELEKNKNKTLINGLEFIDKIIMVYVNEKIKDKKNPLKILFNYIQSYIDDNNNKNLFLSNDFMNAFIDISKKSIFSRVNFIFNDDVRNDYINYDCFYLDYNDEYELDVNSNDITRIYNKGNSIIRPFAYANVFQYITSVGNISNETTININCDNHFDRDIRFFINKYVKIGSNVYKIIRSDITKKKIDNINVPGILLNGKIHNSPSPIIFTLNVPIDINSDKIYFGPDSDSEYLFDNHMIKIKYDNNIFVRFIKKYSYSKEIYVDSETKISKIKGNCALLDRPIPTKIEIKSALSNRLTEIHVYPSCKIVDKPETYDKMDIISNIIPENVYEESKLNIKIINSDKDYVNYFIKTNTSPSEIVKIQTYDIVNNIATLDPIYNRNGSSTMQLLNDYKIKISNVPEDNLFDQFVYVNDSLKSNILKISVDVNKQFINKYALCQTGTDYSNKLFKIVECYESKNLIKIEPINNQNLDTENIRIGNDILIATDNMFDTIYDLKISNNIIKFTHNRGTIYENRYVKIINDIYKIRKYTINEKMFEVTLTLDRNIVNSDGEMKITKYPIFNNSLYYDKFTEHNIVPTIYIDKFDCLNKYIKYGNQVSKILYQFDINTDYSGLILYPDIIEPNSQENILISNLDDNEIFSTSLVIENIINTIKIGDGNIDYTNNNTSYYIRVPYDDKNNKQIVKIVGYDNDIIVTSPELFYVPKKDETVEIQKITNENIIGEYSINNIDIRLKFAEYNNNDNYINYFIKFDRIYRISDYTHILYDENNEDNKKYSGYYANLEPKFSDNDIIPKIGKNIDITTESINFDDMADVTSINKCNTIKNVVDRNYIIKGNSDDKFIMDEKIYLKNPDNHTFDIINKKQLIKFGDGIENYTGYYIKREKNGIIRKILYYDSEYKVAIIENQFDDKFESDINPIKSGELVLLSKDATFITTDSKIPVQGRFNSFIIGSSADHHYDHYYIRITTGNINYHFYKILSYVNRTIITFPEINNNIYGQSNNEIKIINLSHKFIYVSNSMIQFGTETDNYYKNWKLKIGNNNYEITNYENHTVVIDGSIGESDIISVYQEQSNDIRNNILYLKNKYIPWIVKKANNKFLIKFGNGMIDYTNYYIKRPNDTINNAKKILSFIYGVAILNSDFSEQLIVGEKIMVSREDDFALYELISISSLVNTISFDDKDDHYYDGYYIKINNDEFRILFYVNNTIITDKIIVNNNVEQIQVLYYDKLIKLKSDNDYTGYYIKTINNEIAKIMVCIDGKIIIDKPFMIIPIAGQKIILSRYQSFEEFTEIEIETFVETPKLNHMEDSFYDNYYFNNETTTNTCNILTYFKNTLLLKDDTIFIYNNNADNAIFITKYNININSQGIKNKILRINDINNISEGDYIKNYNNEERKIINIIQNIIILEENFTSLPSIGDNLLLIKNNLYVNVTEIIDTIDNNNLNIISENEIYVVDANSSRIFNPLLPKLDNINYVFTTYNTKYNNVDRIKLIKFGDGNTDYTGYYIKRFNNEIVKIDTYKLKTAICNKRFEYAIEINEQIKLAKNIESFDIVGKYIILNIDNVIDSIHFGNEGDHCYDNYYINIGNYGNEIYKIITYINHCVITYPEFSSTINKTDNIAVTNFDFYARKTFLLDIDSTTKNYTGYYVKRGNGDVIKIINHCNNLVSSKILLIGYLSSDIQDNEKISILTNENSLIPFESNITINKKINVIQGDIAEDHYFDGYFIKYNDNYYKILSYINHTFIIDADDLSFVDDTLICIKKNDDNETMLEKTYLIKLDNGTIDYTGYTITRNKGNNCIITYFDMENKIAIVDTSTLFYGFDFLPYIGEIITLSKDGINYSNIVKDIIKTIKCDGNYDNKYMRIGNDFYKITNSDNGVFITSPKNIQFIDKINKIDIVSLDTTEFLLTRLLKFGNDITDYTGYYIKRNNGDIVKILEYINNTAIVDGIFSDPQPYKNEMIKLSINETFETYIRQQITDIIISVQFGDKNDNYYNEHNIEIVLKKTPNEIYLNELNETYKILKYANHTIITYPEITNQYVYDHIENINITQYMNRQQIKFTECILFDGKINDYTGYYIKYKNQIVKIKSYKYNVAIVEPSFENMPSQNDIILVSLNSAFLKGTYEELIIKEIKSLIQFGYDYNDEYFNNYYVKIKNTDVQYYEIISYYNNTAFLYPNVDLSSISDIFITNEKIQYQTFNIISYKTDIILNQINNINVKCCVKLIDNDNNNEEILDVKKINNNNMTIYGETFTHNYINYDSVNAQIITNLFIDNFDKIIVNGTTKLLKINNQSIDINKYIRFGIQNSENNSQIHEIKCYYKNKILLYPEIVNHIQIGEKIQLSSSKIFEDDSVEKIIKGTYNLLSFGENPTDFYTHSLIKLNINDQEHITEITKYIGGKAYINNSFFDGIKDINSDAIYVSNEPIFDLDRLFETKTVNIINAIKICNTYGKTENDFIDHYIKIDDFITKITNYDNGVIIVEDTPNNIASSTTGEISKLAYFRDNGTFNNYCIENILTLIKIDSKTDLSEEYIKIKYARENNESVISYSKILSSMFIDDTTEIILEKMIIENELFIDENNNVYITNENMFNNIDFDILSMLRFKKNNNIIDSKANGYFDNWYISIIDENNNTQIVKIKEYSQNNGYERTDGKIAILENSLINKPKNGEQIYIFKNIFDHIDCGKIASYNTIKNFPGYGNVVDIYINESSCQFNGVFGKITDVYIDTDYYTILFTTKYKESDIVNKQDISGTPYVNYREYSYKINNNKLLFTKLYLINENIRSDDLNGIYNIIEENEYLYRIKIPSSKFSLGNILITTINKKIGNANQYIYGTFQYIGGSEINGEYNAYIDTPVYFDDNYKITKIMSVRIIFDTDVNNYRITESIQTTENIKKYQVKIEKNYFTENNIVPSKDYSIFIHKHNSNGTYIGLYGNITNVISDNIFYVIDFETNDIYTDPTINQFPDGMHVKLLITNTLIEYNYDDDMRININNNKKYISIGEERIKDILPFFKDTIYLYNDTNIYDLYNYYGDYYNNKYIVIDDVKYKIISYDLGAIRINADLSNIIGKSYYVISESLEKNIEFISVIKNWNPNNPLVTDYNTTINKLMENSVDNVLESNEATECRSILNKTNLIETYNTTNGAIYKEILDKYYDLLKSNISSNIKMIDNIIDSIKETRYINYYNVNKYLNGTNENNNFYCPSHYRYGLYKIYIKDDMKYNTTGFRSLGNMLSGDFDDNFTKYFTDESGTSIFANHIKVALSDFFTSERNIINNQNYLHYIDDIDIVKNKLVLMDYYGPEIKSLLSSSKYSSFASDVYKLLSLNMAPLSSNRTIPITIKNMTEKMLINKKININDEIKLYLYNIFDYFARKSSNYVTIIEESFIVEKVNGNIEIVYDNKNDKTIVKKTINKDNLENTIKNVTTIEYNYEYNSKQFELTNEANFDNIENCLYGVVKNLNIGDIVITSQIKIISIKTIKPNEQFLASRNEFLINANTAYIGVKLLNQNGVVVKKIINMLSFNPELNNYHWEYIDNKLALYTSNDDYYIIIQQCDNFVLNEFECILFYSHNDNNITVIEDSIVDIKIQNLHVTNDKITSIIKNDNISNTSALLQTYDKLQSNYGSNTTNEKYATIYKNVTIKDELTGTIVNCITKIITYNNINISDNVQYEYNTNITSEGNPTHFCVWTSINFNNNIYKKIINEIFITEINPTTSTFVQNVDSIEILLETNKIIVTTLNINNINSTEVKLLRRYEEIDVTQEIEIDSTRIEIPMYKFESIDENETVIHIQDDPTKIYVAGENKTLEYGNIIVNSQTISTIYRMIEQNELITYKHGINKIDNKKYIITTTVTGKLDEIIKIINVIITINTDSYIDSNINIDNNFDLDNFSIGSGIYINSNLFCIVTTDLKIVENKLTIINKILDNYSNQKDSVTTVVAFPLYITDVVKKIVYADNFSITASTKILTYNAHKNNDNTYNYTMIVSDYQNASYYQIIKNMMDENNQMFKQVITDINISPNATISNIKYISDNILELTIDEKYNLQIKYDDVDTLKIYITLINITINQKQEIITEVVTDNNDNCYDMEIKNKIGLTTDEIEYCLNVANVKSPIISSGIEQYLLIYLSRQEYQETYTTLIGKTSVKKAYKTFMDYIIDKYNKAINNSKFTEIIYNLNISNKELTDGIVKNWLNIVVNTFSGSEININNINDSKINDYKFSNYTFANNYLNLRSANDEPKTYSDCLGIIWHNLSISLQKKNYYLENIDMNNIPIIDFYKNIISYIYSYSNGRFIDSYDEKNNLVVNNDLMYEYLQSFNTFNNIIFPHEFFYSNQFEIDINTEQPINYYINFDFIKPISNRYMNTIQKIYDDQIIRYYKFTNIKDININKINHFGPKFWNDNITNMNGIYADFYNSVIKYENCLVDNIINSNKVNYYEKNNSITKRLIMNNIYLTGKTYDTPYDFMKEIFTTKPNINSKTQYVNIIELRENPYEQNSSLYKWFNDFILNLSRNDVTLLKKKSLYLMENIIQYNFINDIPNINEFYNDFDYSTNLMQYIYKIIDKNIEKEANINIPEELKIIKYRESICHDLYTTKINAVNLFKELKKTYLTRLNKLVKYDNNQQINILKDLVETMIKSSLSYGWINYLGYFMIDYVSVYIGDQMMEKHTGEWLYIESMKNQKYKSQEKSLKEMICIDLPEMIEINNKPKPEKTLFIPLRFWFNKYQNLALILDAILYQKVYIEVKIKELDELINSGIDIDDIKSPLDFNVDYINQLTEIYVKTPTLNVELIAEYYYVEHKERMELSKKKHEHLIELVQSDTLETTLNNNISVDDEYTVNINFSNTCKEILWNVQPYSNSTKTLTSDTIGGIYNYYDIKNKYDKSSPEEKIIMKKKIELNPLYHKRHINYERKYDKFLHYDVRKGRYIPYFTDAKIEYNGATREQYKDMTYYNYVLPYEQGTTIPEGIFLYRFGLYSNMYQPSGSVNLSQIEKFEIIMKTSDKLKNDIRNKENIHAKVSKYAVTYNILRYMSGFAGLMFMT